jgi:hypothetical protein
LLCNTFRLLPINGCDRNKTTEFNFNLIEDYKICHVVYLAYCPRQKTKSKAVPVTGLGGP